ncbi:MAG: DNA alkylation repair protein [Candidatus Lokiarchaeota archaeon]|nr:DNA alkylation repair protein [Candidatus Lokiarchaeota archaeon]
MIDKVISEIKIFLKKNAPQLTKEQKSRMYKILNSDNPDFVIYGNKHPEIEKFVRKIHIEFELTYVDALEIFKTLIKSNIHDEKMAGIFLLNRFKKGFNRETIELFYDIIPNYYDNWGITDTSMIRMLGPYLAKSGNEKLAENTIEKWSNSENLWVRRAALVILLKLIMVKKEFNTDNVFKLVERRHKDPEEYIHKGIGWLLKTCSNYEPEIIFKYLMKNKGNLSRLILRYASEKLAKEKRAQILKK